MKVYALIEGRKLIPSLNRIDGRYVYDSEGNVYITKPTNYLKVTAEPLLRRFYRVEGLTDRQYDLFYRIAKNILNENK
jgi:hypothetical protein